MTDTLSRWIKLLADSNLTAQFQRKCGITCSPDVNDSSHAFANNNIIEDSGKKAKVGLASTTNGTVIKNGFHGEHISNGYIKERRHLESNGENVSMSVNGASKNGFVSHRDEYSIDNTLLYWLFSFGASLGNELFYTLFFSASVWSFDSLVMRKTLVLWVVNMYVGQLAKDIVKWPRPRSPPVVRLETRYELEYGMPSTHAMVGFILPFGMLYYMSGRYEFSLPVGLTIAVVWCVLVCLSRIYLGMHSVLDVVAGVLFAAFLMLLTIPFVETVDRLILTHPMSPAVAVLASLVLGYTYPRVDTWTTTRGDTMQALGVFTGIYQGLWLTTRSFHSGVAPEALPFIVSVPSVGNLALALTRQIVGVPIVYASLIAAKTVILYVTSWCFGYDPTLTETKRTLAVEIPYKYGQFFVSCSVGMYLMPIIFVKLNIGRSGLYTECSSYFT
ncbi:Sphingosine-1-phosphate phosphatase 2 [Bulinus truncatus]|nr:Sphingosine-1-phosphate phosphatase 2 [Bulinus truncatus]